MENVPSLPRWCQLTHGGQGTGRPSDIYSRSLPLLPLSFFLQAIIYIVAYIYSLVLFVVFGLGQVANSPSIAAKLSTAAVVSVAMQPGRMRSGSGRCVLCRNDFVDLLEHVRKRHAGHRFNPGDFRRTSLVVCPCGVVTKNERGLSHHQRRYGCAVGWDGDGSGAPRGPGAPGGSSPGGHGAPPGSPFGGSGAPSGSPAGGTGAPGGSTPESLGAPPSGHSGGHGAPVGDTPRSRGAPGGTSPEPHGAPGVENSGGHGAPGGGSVEALVAPWSPTPAGTPARPTRLRRRAVSQGSLGGNTVPPAPRPRYHLHSTRASAHGFEGERGDDVTRGDSEDNHSDSSSSSNIIVRHRHRRRQPVFAVSSDSDSDDTAVQEGTQRAPSASAASPGGVTLLNNPTPSLAVDTCVSAPQPSFHLQSIQETFRALACLPTTYKPLSPAVYKAFLSAADRLAVVYIEDPSDLAVLDFLALPKVGLAPGLIKGHKPVERLAHYPNVNMPSSPTRYRQRQPATQVQALVETGRISSASRHLEGSAAVLPATPAVVETLHSKHPSGTVNPFGPLPGPVNGSCPSEDTILDTFHSFKSDTAPGISGWTVPMLKIALRSKNVIKMVRSLCAAMLAGKAPGQPMWCASRLIALAKPDGGVRPIAIGELVYRLCTKATLRHLLRPDFLLPTQFGVGTPGGVEPIIHAVDQAVSNPQLGHTHLVSLDFRNAFNTIDRCEIAAAARAHAPVMYRLAKWAYNSPADLVMTGTPGTAVPPPLLSSQGVRQGDPLGPFLFSLGIRPLLHDLAVALGPDCTVLAYLDDIYILSNSAGTLDSVHQFFHQCQPSLHLNMDKSTIIALDSIHESGHKLLGSVVGPRSPRADFLRTKITTLKAKLDRLPELPHQHALLLLRLAIQQDLRHLQRSLKSDDLTELWQELDTAMWDACRLIRGSSGPLNEAKDNALMALPVRKGGLGLLSHEVCAPHAYAASQDASQRVLAAAYGTATPNDPPPKSQRERCQQVFAQAHSDFLQTLNIQEQQAVMEAGSVLGRQWLSVIPFNLANRLTDFEVSAAIHLRTLQASSWTTCRHCGQPNRFGHDEVCASRAKWTVARHEQVKHVLASTLSTLDGVQVTLEPFIAGTTRRNDICITGSRASGMANHEYDITVVSLATHDATATVPPPRLDPTTSVEAIATATAHRFLDSIARNKRRRLPPGATVPFTPLVFSVGGLMDPDTAKALNLWKGSLSVGTFKMLLLRLSLTLLRARVRNFDL